MSGPRRSSVPRAWLLACLAVACHGSASTKESELLGISITPADALLKTGESLAYTARGYYADRTIQDLTGELRWQSSDPSIVSVTDDTPGKGTATALALGEADIIASLGDALSAGARITVTGGSVVSLAIAPSTAEILAGEGLQLRAEATFDDDTTGNVAASCTWSVDDDAVASVGVEGWVDALRPGSTRVHATYQGQDLSPATLTVLDASTVQTDPDLAIRYFDGLSDGIYTFWIVEVTNAGGSTASSFWIDVFYDRTSAPPIGATGDDFLFVGELVPGDTVTWEPDVDDGPTTTWSSWVLADSVGQVAESDEGNNTAGMSLGVW